MQPNGELRCAPEAGVIVSRVVTVCVLQVQVDQCAIAFTWMKEIRKSFSTLWTFKSSRPSYLRPLSP